MILLYYLAGAATVTTVFVMMVMVYRYAFQKGWDIRDAIVTGNKDYFEKLKDYHEPAEFALIDKQEKKPEIEEDDED